MRYVGGEGKDWRVPWEHQLRCGAEERGGKGDPRLLGYHRLVRVSPSVSGQ